jgi:hypothetical protein
MLQENFHVEQRSCVQQNKTIKGHAILYYCHIKVRRLLKCMAESLFNYVSQQKILERKRVHAGDFLRRAFSKRSIKFIIRLHHTTELTAGLHIP